MSTVTNSADAQISEHFPPFDRYALRTAKGLNAINNITDKMAQRGLVLPREAVDDAWLAKANAELLRRFGGRP